MKWPSRRRKQQVRQAAVRSSVPHRHDYRKIGTVEDSEGTHTVWKCKSCPSRMRD